MEEIRPTGRKKTEPSYHSQSVDIQGYLRARSRRYSTDPLAKFEAIQKTKKLKPGGRMLKRWIGQSEDGETVQLRRFRGEFVEQPPEKKAQALAEDRLRYGLIVDVETTGKDASHDHVIEIGARLFSFDRVSLELLSLEKSYSGLEDPGIPIPEQITRITGINDEMVKGKKIDWDQVSALFNETQVVIAHNAAFDRSFLDKRISVSSEKVWACTYKLIDWYGMGFGAAKLEVLSIFHGFFVNAHRALEDCDALLHLLCFQAPESTETYLGQLLANSRRPVTRVIAHRTPFELKDLLKERGYQWSIQKRVWHHEIGRDECEKERQWLTESVYGGFFAGELREVRPQDRFKSF